MSKNIFRYKLEKVEDITLSTFYKEFLEKEANKKIIETKTIYILLSKISFNIISKIANDISRKKEDVKIVVILNKPKNAEQVIGDFMNNLSEGNISTNGSYPKNAKMLLNLIDQDKLEFCITNEIYNLNAICGHTALLGISNLSIDKNFKNGYVFWEDYEEYISDIRHEIEHIYRNSKQENSIKLVLRYMAKNYTVQEIYNLMILNIFQVQEYKDEKNSIKKLKMSEQKLWQQLYDFQKDGVYGLIHRLEKNGCAILSDSVGLGKTFQALAVIQYYHEKHNEKTLVLTPVKLMENWKRESVKSKSRSFESVRIPFDVHKHNTVVSEKTPQNELVENFDYSQYDLVVIDEAHAFRNEASKRYKETINKIMLANPKMKVLLLSATPVNNSLKDLTALIKLMSKNANVISIDGEKINYGAANKKAQRQIDQGLEPDEKFYEMLDNVLVSRDKNYIKDVYTGTDLKMRFPQKQKAISLTPELSYKEEEEINKFYSDISKMNFAIYNYFAYIKEDRKIYYTKQEKNISERSKGMKSLMMMLLLKRYESTFKSLKSTIKKMIDQMEKWLEIKNVNLEQFSRNTIRNKGVLIFDENGVEKEDVEIVDFPVSKDDFIPEFFEAIKEDIKILESISENNFYKEISNKKIDKLLTQVEKINKNGEKVIIFTSYTDTAEELSDEFRKKNIDHGFVCGTNQYLCLNAQSYQKKEYEEVLVSFSPVSKKKKNNNPEIDILIATDVISEGQNLQDCNNIINFDVHWNPVRIIQRLGRIDRINSKHNYINNYIFWPVSGIESYLNMRERIGLKNNYISAVGVEGYEYDSNFNTSREDLKKIAEGSDIENQKIKFSSKINQKKKFEIDHKRIKSEITKDSIFFDINEYIYQLRGITSFVYSTDKFKSSYFLYRASSKNKINIDLYPYILIELNEENEIKFKPIESLEKIKKIKFEEGNKPIKVSSSDDKRNFFNNKFRNILGAMPQKIVWKYPEINKEELSLVCAIFVIPNKGGNLKKMEESNNYKQIENSKRSYIEAQKGFISKEKQNSLFD